ncbi:MAG: carboxypeptidase-like regulatory domain-containing protein, partial [Terriglobia bacterium]
MSRDQFVAARRRPQTFFACTVRNAAAAVRPLLAALILAILAITLLPAAEHRGLVTYGELPLPGATVTASQGEKKVTAVAGEDGIYTFPNLADGVWTLQVEMLCFAPLKQDLTVGPNAPLMKWDLKMLPADEIKAASVAAPPPPLPPVSTTALTPDSGRPSIKAPAPKGKKGVPPPPAVNTPGGFQRAGVNANSDAAPSPPASEAPAN